MKKYIILALFLAMHTCVQGASGGSNREEFFEQTELSEADQDQVVALTGEPYGELSYEGLCILRKERPDLCDIIDTQWVRPTLGSGNKVKDGKLYRNGYLVGSFEHEKLLKEYAVVQQAAKKIFDKLSKSPVGPFSSAASAGCVLDKEFKEEHDTRLQTPSDLSGRESTADFSANGVSPASQITESFFQIQKHICVRKNSKK
jgi:hypothetical protein